MKSKTKGLSIFISNFATYTIYSWVAEKEQKSLRCVKGAIAFLNSMKGAIKKKRVLKALFYIMKMLNNITTSDKFESET